MNETPEPTAQSAPQPAVARPAFLDGAPPFEIMEGRYVVRFARSANEIAAALRLRYEVFNLELGEGLEESHVHGRDEDHFDASCHHLLVLDGVANRIVGTYRLQTREMARAGHGFYSAGEYLLSDIPDAILSQSIEIGRACVAREHRKQKVLFGLWKGLAAYVTAHHKRYLFGCCSLTSQNPREGRAVMALLRRDGKTRTDFHVRCRPAFACRDPDPSPPELKGLSLPTLFGTYLRFGALACSEPAIDRTFKTIDFLVLMDTATLPSRTRQTFFG